MSLTLIGVAIMILLLWLAFKVVKFAFRIALYIAMIAVAYWLLARAFDWPIPWLEQPIHVGAPSTPQLPAP